MALQLSESDIALLKACLGEDEVARDGFRVWRASTHPDKVTSRELRLMPLLVAQLQRLGIDDPATGRLKGQAKHIWLVGMMRRRSLARAFDALAAAGLEVGLIKGAAMSARWGDAVSTRPSGDFDLLLPSADIKRALTALYKAGWKGPSPDVLVEDDFRRFHAIAVSDRAGNDLDLHWRPSKLIADETLGAGILARMSDATIEDRRIRVPQLADHLFIVVSHAALEAAHPRLEWLADLALLLSLSRSPDWDWAHFARLSHHHALADLARDAFRLIDSIAPSDLAKAALTHLEAARSGASEMAVGHDVVLSRSELPIAVALDRALESVASLDHLAVLPEDGFDLARDPTRASLLEGWSLPEQSGRWSDGPRALLGFRVPDALPADGTTLRVRGEAALQPGRSPPRIEAWAGNESVALHLMRGVTCGHVGVRLRSWRGARIVALGLVFPDLDAPGSNSDPRQLGIFMRRLDWIRPEQSPILSGPLDFGGAAADCVAGRGWGDPQGEGRWSVAREAEIHFRVPYEASRRLRAVLLIFRQSFSHSRKPQSLEVELDGAPVTRAVVPRWEDEPPGFRAGGLVEVALPLDLAPGCPVTLRLRVSHPASPASADKSPDFRNLGVLLSHVVPVKFP